VQLISDVKMVVTYESTVVWEDTTSFQLLSRYWLTENENKKDKCQTVNVISLYDLVTTS